MNVDAAEAPSRGATRFFWTWLTIATSASIAGNVVGAVIHSPNGSTVLTAGTAMVPPVVLLGSTHSVALLMRSRKSGGAYWCALSMTLALAGCAFVLSFDALSELAATAGIRHDRAWLWPCAIDVSIAQSTLALLALTSPPPDRTRVAESRVLKGAATETPPDGASRALKMASDVAGEWPKTTSPPTHAVPDGQWCSEAKRLIDAGVTQKEPAVVARILAEHAAGTPPSTISRRLAVHHSTVGRILAGSTERR